ncbi:MAG: hypothetical protein ACI9TH_000032 [Kiritimatiellia bacterium]|jgi:hypothetical protein
MRLTVRGNCLGSTVGERKMRLMPIPLTIELLKEEAGAFAERESKHDAPELYGVTDGKRIGTYLEHKLWAHLDTKYTYKEGSSAGGLDFPGLKVDLKITSLKQPQSSCPFRSARQKIYGLGYGLLIFVYDKSDNDEANTGRLTIEQTVFVEAARTADFQTTSGLRMILDNQGNLDDIMAYFADRNLPLDEIQSRILAEEVLKHPPEIGYLTISNALQWRLQYSRVIQQAGAVEGVDDL